MVPLIVCCVSLVVLLILLALVVLHRWWGVDVLCLSNALTLLVWVCSCVDTDVWVCGGRTGDDCCVGV